MSAGLIQRLIEAGTPADLVSEVAIALARAEADREVLAERRENERKRKQRQRHGTERDSAGQGVTAVTPPPDKEGPQTPKEINPSPKKTPTGQKKGSPRSELEAVLDAERAEAVIDHRQRLRKPLTAHAARLLAQKLARCPNPNAAADLMIERGWQSVKPEWVQNAGDARSLMPERGQRDENDPEIQAYRARQQRLTELSERIEDGTATQAERDEFERAFGLGRGSSGDDGNRMVGSEAGQHEPGAMGEQRGGLRALQGPSGQPGMEAVVSLPPDERAASVRGCGSFEPVHGRLGQILASARPVATDGRH